MSGFIEKWKTDKKFNSKVQICLYLLFFIIVAIYATAGTPNINNDAPLKNTYNYQMNININDKIYNYSGTKNEDEIIINKTVDDLTTKYIYKDNQYFQNENNTYVSVDEKEIYEMIEFSYLSINTIDKYLKLSTPRENDNIVYLYDIIVGNNSEEYITIESKEGYYKVDYTQLMKLFKSDIEKAIIEIIIE